jgi:hypothetical protein
MNKTFYRVYDNGGSTFDRYTLLVGDRENETRNHIYMMSHNPLSPQGVNNYSFTTEGLMMALVTIEGSGKRIRYLEDLPQEVQTAIKQRIEGND